MKLFGFIGAGNMGYPMLMAGAKVFGNDQVCYYDATNERNIMINKETGIKSMDGSGFVARISKFIILAIKPQYYETVLSEIKNDISRESMIISIAPGITIDSIKDMLSKDVRVIRAMPNTNAMIEESMTGVCYSKDVYLDEEKDLINKFFTSFGKVEIFEETLMDAVVCANGSSPAYVYMFIEALADSVVKYGIPRDKAYTLVAQTVLGSAKTVLETKKHPGELKDMVCSPGGTTIAGVAALEENGFRNAIIKATDACFKRAKSLKDN